MTVTLSQDMRKVVLDILRTLGSPKALECASHIEANRWRELTEMSVVPGDYSTSEAYFADAQAVDLLRKMPGLPTGINTRLAAEETFLDCEIQNKKTNERLSHYRMVLDYPLHDDDRSDPILDVIREIRKTIKHILGPIQRSDITSGMSITGGSTYSHKGKFGSLLPSKLSALPEMTNPDLVIFTKLEETMWFRIHHSILFESGPCLKTNYTLVRGNRFGTVPKDSKKDRGIAVEPTLNLYFQKGIGAAIRQRLQRKLGLLLVPKNETFDEMGTNDDTSPYLEAQTKHRVLAQQASRDGKTATIDLSNASDLICYELVCLLMPEDWFSALSLGRSPRTLFRRKWHVLEKFSSMGNAFTFELETLIFYAITSTIAKLKRVDTSSISVYGDDILLPSECFEDVCAALRFFGMTPNPKKSFATGPFRESCGGDYFKGADVRPIQFKKDPQGPTDWMVVHNLVVRLSGKHPGCFKPILNFIKGLLPRQVRICAGPVYYGDSVLHSGNRDDYTLRARAGQLRIRCVIPIAGTVPTCRWGGDSATGALILLKGQRNGFQLRDDIRGYRVRWVAFLS